MRIKIAGLKRKFLSFTRFCQIYLRGGILTNPKKISASKDPSAQVILSSRKITQKFKPAEGNDDIYAFAPELKDRTVPLRDSLEIAETVNSEFKKASKRVLKNLESGLSAKVRFLRFKNDPVQGRWLAIKRPVSIFQKVF